MFCRLLERGFRNDDVEGLEEVLNGELTEGILPSIDDCETALVRASALGFKQSVSRLLAHGCDPDCQDPDGETPLHAAAANGHLDVVKLLLFCDCDINSQTFDNRTALHMAVWSGNRQMAKCLIDAGCDMTVQDSYGDTATMLCSRRGLANKNILKLLLRLDKHLDIQNKEGDTALIHTARYGRHENARMLINAGANVNVKNMWGLTALHYACCNKFPEMISMFLEAGADVSITESSGRSMLHYLAKHGFVDSAKQLIARGAKVDGRDADGNTCLIEAIANHHRNMVQMLVLEAGCNVNFVGKATIYGQFVACTPLAYATYTCEYDIANLLHAAGAEWGDALNENLGDMMSGFFAWMEPRSLYGWSRVHLRNALGVNLLTVVDKLPIPRALKDFLKFKDCTK